MEEELKKKVTTRNKLSHNNKIIYVRGSMFSRCSGARYIHREKVLRIFLDGFTPFFCQKKNFIIFLPVENSL